MKFLRTFIFVVIAFIFIQSFLAAQWVQTNGPYGGQILCLVQSGNNLFAGTDLGVYFSTDNGYDWHPSFMNDGYFQAMLVYNDGMGDTNIFAGTYGMNLFRSSDNGSNWLSTSLKFKSVFSLLESGSNLLVGTDGGISLSTDNGFSWKQVNVDNQYTYGVLALISKGTIIFAGTEHGVFRSTDNGNDWEPSNSGISNVKVHAFALFGDNFFAGTDNGIFLSTDKGISWTAVNTGLTNEFVRALVINGEYLFA